MARFFIVIPFHDSMPMRHCANQNILMTDCAGRATVAIRYISWLLRCPCILHSDADCMSGLKSGPCRLCILQRRSDCGRRFCPVPWTTKPGMRLRCKSMCR